MAFTRSALFLRWDDGTVKRAFKVLRGEYAGGMESPKHFLPSLMSYP